MFNCFKSSDLRAILAHAGVSFRPSRYAGQKDCLPRTRDVACPRQHSRRSHNCSHLSSKRSGRACCLRMDKGSCLSSLETMSRAKLALAIAVACTLFEVWLLIASARHRDDGAVPPWNSARIDGVSATVVLFGPIGWTVWHLAQNRSPEEKSANQPMMQVLARRKIRKLE